MMLLPAAAPLRRARVMGVAGALFAACTWLVATLALARYLWRGATSLISSDQWTFADIVLRPAFERGLQLTDLLARRTVADHAQPLNKLVLWLNATWLGLDFRCEGYLGLVFAAVGAAWLMQRAVAVPRGAARAPAVWLVAAALAALWLSVDSTYLWRYTLVTLTFGQLLLFIGWVLLAWSATAWARPRWRMAVLLPFAWLAAVLADDTALLVNAAVSLALLLAARHRGRWRATGEVIAWLWLGWLLARGVYAAFGPVGGAVRDYVPVAAADKLAGLWARRAEAWAWWEAVSAGGIAYRAPLGYFAGSSAAAWQTAIAVLMLALHGWFWWRQWRRPADGTSVLASALMLFYYVIVAGLLWARVADRGDAYLYQPRYVQFYQLAPVAMLLLASRLVGERPAGVARKVVALAVLVVLALQGLWWRYAWIEQPAVVAFEQAMAAQVVALANDPAHPPVPCTREIAPCVMPVERRDALIAFLRGARLNLFDPAFASAHPALAPALTGLRHAPMAPAPEPLPPR
jgi:hypothetical protein